ncbi:Protein MS5 [Arabidopsis thaliana x Arabidopsis arenosa]|uniref:Protein MS5 n=1 Tax=Arabidopsis thaliana x Arabidopsis arenosa TaxID=1240361 RepID=A0A8T2D5H1_9BRAS|nr:Protein MS5 [Arabidopsis thaliana x Arabidopsis arenosa]
MAWLIMEEEEVDGIPVNEFGRLEIDFDYGFDFTGIVTPPVSTDYDVTLYAKLGLYCYNFQKGTNLKFVRWEKYNTSTGTAYIDNYITLEAMDPSCNSVFSFQTVFSAAGCYNQDTYHVQDWRVLACRPTCGKSVNEYFDRHEAMDPFYTGKMPKWLSDDALAFDNKKYYVVQESDLHENDWLLVFMEMVFLQENPGVSSSDHKAIIRKTMDGVPEHMSLEIALVK